MITIRHSVDIFGFSDYTVDILGNIYKKKDGSLVKQYIGFGSYLWVNLKKDKRYYTKAVAPLVLLSFIGEKPLNTECCHGRLGRCCNFLSNLSWKSHKENCSEDIIRDGTILRGKKNKKSKLTEEKVLQIRNLKENKSYLELSKMFGVSKTHIRNIVKRNYWNYI
jgi:hypothetical protein